MKRLFFALAMISILLFACSIPSTPTQVAPTQPPVPTTPPVSTNSPIPTKPPEPTNTILPTVPPGPAANVTCNELSFYLDPQLGSGYNCETVPATSEGIGITPQYTNATLQGYVLSNKFWDAHISILPVAQYVALLPDTIPGQVVNLQVLIGGGSAGDTLPLLPVFNAAQVFHAQYQVLPFSNGSGIRFITLYAQYYAPINNHDVFYTYQGLTSDGLYWVSAIFPINNPILPDNGDTPPGGMSQEEFSANYASYLTNITNQLNSQTSDSFTPKLAALDALVASITIQP
jgi:hypothetical protein